MKLNEQELKELEEIVELLRNKETFMLGINLMKSKKYIESYEMLESMVDSNRYLIECTMESKLSTSEVWYFVDTIRKIRDRLDKNRSLGSRSFPMGGPSTSSTVKNTFRMADCYL